MIRLKMKNYIMILTQKQQKYQHYFLDKYEYLKGEEMLVPNQRRVIALDNTPNQLSKFRAKHCVETNDQ